MTGQQDAALHDEGVSGPFNMWAVIEEKGVPFLIMISKGFYAIPCLAAAGTRNMARYISEGITTYVGWPLLET